MSKKRPGYEAAKRLSETLDVSVWERVEAQSPQVLSSITNLPRLNDSRNKLAQAIASAAATKKANNGVSLSKEELMLIVSWKFSVGKSRNALLKHLHSNTEESICELSKLAIAKARAINPKNAAQANDNKNDAIKDAIEELTALKGVGPATASAVLSMVRPDIFCYMYDEVIDCFMPKRTYTLPVYLKINEECTRISESMEEEGWTPFRVSQALWVAAKICAAGGDDQTLSSNSTSKRKSQNDEKATKSSTSKKSKTDEASKPTSSRKSKRSKKS